MRCGARVCARAAHVSPADAAARRARNRLRVAQELVAQTLPGVATDSGFARRVGAALRRDGWGGADRRLYRELLWTATRYWPWVERCAAAGGERLFAVAPLYLAAATPEALELRDAVRDELPEPADDLAGAAAALGAAAGVELDVNALLPAWFAEECPSATEADREVLMRRAPVWLRLQAGDAAAEDAALEALGAFEPSRSAALASAVRLDAPYVGDVTRTAAFKDGHVEVQDIGSQLLLEMAGVQEGSRWLDACAGAGGKALQLARLVGRYGTVDAADPVRPAALAELRKRARRAGLENVHTLKDGGATTAGWDYDGVLVDAPCSGSGTWRRAPHLKWQTTPATLDEKAELQGNIIASQAPRVRPGGTLVYATCSLATRENDAVVGKFLERNPQFEPVVQRTILPSEHDSDGFFVAALRRVR